MVKGKDDFGIFEIMAAKCGRCNSLGIVVNYTPSIKLPEDIHVEDTILGHPSRSLGIQCGHYARFHRQVAHIQDKIKARTDA